jgi:hypothetical protein
MTIQFSLLWPVVLHPCKFSLEVSMLSVKRRFLRRGLHIYNEYITAGQAFMMKLRKTAERSPTSMIIEPPQDINGSYSIQSDHPRWRYLKCVAICVLFECCIDTEIDNPWGRMSALLVIVWISCGLIVKPTNEQARSNPRRMLIVSRQRLDFGTLSLTAFQRLTNMRPWWTYSVDASRCDRDDLPFGWLINYQFMIRYRKTFTRRSI